MSPALRFLAVSLFLLAAPCPCARRKSAGAGAGHGDHRSARVARTRSWPFRPHPHHCADAIGRHAADQQPVVRAAVDGCRSARRSMPISSAISQGTRPSLPNESIGVGTSFDFQLFDRALFNSPDTRFVLSGIVNRMDRAFRSPKQLRRDQADLPPDPDRACREAGEVAASPRLPMTLNVVLKAKADHAVDANGDADHLRRDRAALACRRRFDADRRRARRKT